MVKISYETYMRTNMYLIIMYNIPRFMYICINTKKLRRADYIILSPEKVRITFVP
jgi:hypothetical protein